MEQEAQDMIEESDMIQVQGPQESNDDFFGNGLPEMNLPDMELDMGLGLDF